MFQKRAETPIENRDYSTFYLVFSGLLLLATLWAVVDEVFVRRPWKGYQSEYDRLSVEKLRAQYNDAMSAVDSSTAADLRSRLAEARQKLDSKEYHDAVRRLDGLQMDLADATRAWRFARSNSDALYYQYSVTLHDGHPSADLKKKLDDLDVEIAADAKKMDDINGSIDSANAMIGGFKDTADSLDAALTALYADATKLETKIASVEQSPLEIKQVLLNDYDKSNFGEVKARVDRCQTCHLGATDKNMADAPQPFTTHSHPELLKIHNPEKYGCTPCHRGQGHALTVGEAHGEADPFWETPILRGMDVYASCSACHTSRQALKGAAYFSKARQTFLESGCYGCHDIDGYKNLPKIGPQLNSIPAKLQPEWVYRWIRDPKNYNPHTRMPNFKLSEKEAGAVTAYLFSIGKESTFSLDRPKGFYAGGSASLGKEHVENFGCKACHVIGDDVRVRNARGSSYDIAPELTHAAGKLNPDWIFDWIKNPRHYNPTTKMPSLRLSDQEARDIVAYLMTMRDDRPKEAFNVDINSEENIALGKTVIRQYGCFGCHDIKGMETEGKVSVDLSDFGRKLVEQMDFGDTKVKHTWADWVGNKLRNSRVFQTDRIVQRMPVFALSDTEISMIRSVLLSFRADNPQAKYRVEVTDSQTDLDAGEKLTIRYGCINCHQLEERGGYFAAILDDPTKGPPLLTIEGGKVQEPWLQSFLKSPSPIRPWLKVRMPTFSLTEDEINTVTKYFLALSGQSLEMRDYASFTPDPHLLADGTKLFNTFQCIKCHQLGGAQIDPKSVAPNLELARNRLKPEWVISWLRNPEAIQPGTMMPGYFPDGQSPLPDVLKGDATLQMRAIRDHLFTLGKKKN
ncbi:MAG TPA: c-type cytochrome [Bacteroidota bacterium]|nr:c-type cytochrome [Bacteroidota bacterium]